MTPLNISFIADKAKNSKGRLSTVFLILKAKSNYPKSQIIVVCLIGYTDFFFVSEVHLQEAAIMKLVQDKYGESIVVLDSGEDFHLPENEISKIRRQVIVLGYAGVVDLERGGADDFSSRSYFRRALYRPNIDTEIQLEGYRNLLFQIIDVSSDMMKGPIAKCELRRLPRDIHLRLVMNTLRDLHSSTGSMAIEAFYDSLGYSKSTGNKLCHEGYALQEFFRLRLIGDQSETIYEGLPADIGGCNMATMRHLTDFLSFKYISQISEITDIKCHQKRYQMLSNPSMSRLLNGEIVQNKIADLKVSCIRDLVKRLNKGEAIDDVLNANCSNDQSDDSQNPPAFGKLPHRKLENSLLGGAVWRYRNAALFQRYQSNNGHETVFTRWSLGLSIG